MLRCVFLTIGLLLLGATWAFAEAPGPVPEELLLRRQEAQLLHRRLDLSGLRVLRKNEFVPAQVPVGRLVLVHLWAIECRPCVEELPALQGFFSAQAKDPRVKLLLVSETKDKATLLSFLSQRRGFFPNVDLYQNGQDSVRGSVQNFAQPLTLLLDERGVIHQAFVGTLRARRGELVDAVNRYFSSL